MDNTRTLTSQEIAYSIAIADSIGKCNQIKEVLNNRTYTTPSTPTIEELEKMTKNEKLVALHIVDAIARHSINKLYSKGNEIAIALSNNENRTVSTDDLTQLVYLTLFENIDNWDIGEDNKLIFSDKKTMGKVFGAISHYLYEMSYTRGNRTHLYIDFYNDDEIEVLCTVRYNDIKALSTIADIDYISTSVFIQTINKELTTKQQNWLEYRLQGESNSNICNILGITPRECRTIERNVRKIAQKHHIQNYTDNRVDDGKKRMNKYITTRYTNK